MNQQITRLHRNLEIDMSVKLNEEAARVAHAEIEITINASREEVYKA
jgi:hypothetical protein